MKKLLAFINSIRYNVPLYYTDKWYNYAAHISDEVYPNCWDEKGKYRDCLIGGLYKMSEDHYHVFYYRIIDRWCKNSGGDWLYDTDCIRCSLIFDHAEKKKNV